MGMRNKRIILSPSVTILWCLSYNFQRAGKMNLIYLASKRVIQTWNTAGVTFSRKDRLLLSDLMHELADLGIQTSKRVRFYSDSLKLGKKINPEIWGSPGSRQLLHLQQFPKILKKFGTPFYFEVVSFLFLISPLLILAYGFWSAFWMPSIDWFLII